MTFAAPLFLLGLLGLFLPWLLHRLNEQDAPVRDFPSEQFLEPARSVSARRKRLRYLKLLCLRVLMLLVLCLLFADPLLKKLQQVLGDPEQLHVIVLDQSFSMRFGTHWDDAQLLVDDVLSDIPANMSVQLLSTSPALSNVTAPTLDRSVIETAAASLRPGFGRVEYGPLMRMLGSFAEKSDLPVVVHLITDAQASGLPVRMSELLSQPLAELSVHTVDSGSLENVSLEASIKPSDDRQFSIVATLRGYAMTAGVNKRTVSLRRLGTEVAQREVSLSENGMATVEFDNLDYPPEGRLVNYELALTPTDELADDDTVTVPVRLAPPAYVRIVTNSTQADMQNSNEVLYSRTALELDRRNRSEFERLSSSGIAENTDAIIFLDSDVLADTNAANTSSTQLPPALTAYLQQGGHVLRVVNASASDGDPQELAPMAVATVASVDSIHPLNLDLDEWSFVSFYSHSFSATPVLSADDRSNVLVTATDGHPVLAESEWGDGKLLQLNASLNGTDNDLPISAVFVPFLHSVIDYFVRFEGYPSRLAVGDSVKLPKSVQVLDPAGKPLLELAQTTDGNAHVMLRPGVYTILDKRGEHSVVVETDPAESDTTVADSILIENWQAQNSESPVTADTPVDGATASSSQATDSIAISLAKWLLPLCVLLVAMESLFANWYLKVRRTA